MHPRKRCLLLAVAGSCILPACMELQAQTSFTRGPFVQNATSNSIQVIWRTAAAASTCVAYGLSQPPEMTITNGLLVNNHVVTLTNLTLGATYYYQVISENGGGRLSSAVESCRTLKTEGPVSFEVVSDTAGGGNTTSNLALRMITSNPDLVVHCGDVVSRDFNDTSVGTEFFNPFQPLIKNTPVYLIPGNHDTDSMFGGDGGTNFQNAFYLPTNSATGTELFYSFDHGDVHFVCLFDPWFRVYVPTVGDAQYNWLTNDLARSTKPWKLIFGHFPLATTAFHYNDNYNGNTIWDQYELMNLLAPLAQQYGVQMFFSGHDHCFQRFAPTNGMHAIVNGSGGQSLYSYANMHSALAQFWKTYSFLRVSITNDTLFLQAVGTDGLVFDSMTVQRTSPARQTYEATWHTVSFRAGVANDGDGNIAGQSFDFIGNPLFPRTGQFSNLGQVFVNNDSTNLYIGFQQVMTYANNNIFLFVESPRLTGVGGMAGIGNGIIDPAGQGADGLDCLENLSFTNFMPAIGCLLGDEYADGQFRSFARSNLALNIGQGVYALDANLEDIAGARLHQFNRSPQPVTVSSPISLEQNADLIELAIPLSALGGIRPGDTIKLGAVVGGPGYDPAAQTRQLDTSALGYSLTGSGQGHVVLEGVSVQLATDPDAVRVAISVLGPNQCQLGWNAVIGKAYDIDYAAGSLTNFVHLDTRTAAATNETYSITITGGTGFYRIKQLP